MASSSSPPTEELLSVGKQCKHPTCLLVDFLPFKCEHCQQSFCQEHFKVADHRCLKYDEFKHNRVAPDCPFCKTPVAIKPGQDPNDRLEQHFINECSVYAGKTAKKSPVCARARCGKTLFAPIRCDQCTKQFCPSHRFPADHNCTAVVAPIATPAPSPKASGSRTAGLTASSRLLNLTSKVGSSKPSTTKVPAAVPGPSKVAPPKAEAKSPAGKTSSSATPNPFSKTDSSSRLTLSFDSSDFTNPLASTTRNKLIQPNIPEPIIKPTSFAPPPVFATA